MKNSNWKVFWRITFDVVGSTARLQQELTLWELFPYVRLGRQVKDLTPGMGIHGSVHFINDKAVFDGGFLECEIHLNQDVEALLVAVGIDPSEPTVLSRVSESINGENVSIRADVALYDASHAAEMVEYPIFYFPQPTSPEGLRLLEDVTDPQQRIVRWWISNQTQAANQPFGLEAFEAQHSLRVRQGVGPGVADVFQFLVDSIPLDEVPTVRNHDFTGEPQSFFIGGTPDHPGGFFGEINYLDFDPNSSCGSCAG
jgi:hypothetical protein